MVLQSQPKKATEKLFIRVGQKRIAERKLPLAEADNRV
jgi:hypothetical protein